MAEEEVKKEVKVVAHHPADTNGDGKVSEAEEAMYLEFKRKELEDADAMRDAQRKMTWFALAGLLLYPLAVVIASIGRFNRSTENTRQYGTNIFCCSSRNSGGLLWRPSIHQRKII